MKTEYDISIDGVGEHVINLYLAPREALFLASRILNQLNLRDQTSPIEVMLPATVKVRE